MYKLLIKDRSNEYQVLSIAGEGGLILEANNPLEYEFGKANKTFSIMIKNTDSNNDLLDNLFTKTFEYKVRFDDVFLGIEDNLLLKGVLKAHEFNKKEARCQFISTNYDLIEALKTHTLQDYDYDTSHVVNETNQIASEGLTLNSGNVIYDLIDRGKSQYHANSPKTNINLYQDRLAVSERFPAVRVKKIMDTLFAGYTITGNHFTNTLFSEKQYLLFSRPNIGITGDQNDWDRNRHNIESKYKDDKITEYDIGGLSGFNFTIYRSTDMRTIVTDDKSMNSSERYRIRTNGVYNIEFNCEGIIQKKATNPVITNCYVTAIIYKGATVIKYDVIPYDLIFGVDVEAKFYITTGNIYLLNEDVIRCEMTIDGDIDFPLAGATFTHKISASDSFGSAKITTAIGEGSTINVHEVLPNIKAADFVRAYLKEFNLQLFINTETLQVIFWKQQGEAVNDIDITENIIAGSISVTPDNERANYIFKRKITDAKIAALDEYEDINKAKFVDNSGSDTVTFESEFSTTHEEVIAKLGMTENSPQIWRTFSLINPTEQPLIDTNAGLRLVYDAGAKTASYYLERIGTTVSPLRTTYRKISPATADFDSHFTGDLFDDYHAENINNKVFGHILECDLLVTDELIRAFYYLDSAKDWRNNFIINLSGFTGLYKFIQLKRKKDNVYQAIMYKLL